MPRWSRIREVIVPAGPRVGPWMPRSATSPGKDLVTAAGRGHRRSFNRVAVGVVIAGLLVACSGPPSVQGSRATPTSVVNPALKGIHKIRHVIIIMQENRSLDSYFGTYPGVDGIPMRNGVPTVCVPNPKGPCTRPYHDTADINGGGPHGAANAIAHINGGRI